jgi:hypothetical protein
MQLPENPILRVFAVIFAIGFGVVALGYLGVIGLLIAVSLPNGTKYLSTAPAQTATTEIYLRNRTSAPMRVVLTVARPALQPDSVWWPVAISPEAVGQALALHDSLVAQGMYYPLPVPLLLPGTADTLIDKNFDDSLPRFLLQHKRYNNRPSVYEHTHRHFISPPELGPQEPGLHSVPGAPDSLRLVLDVLPDSSLRVARRRVAYFTDEAGASTALEGPGWPYPGPELHADDGPGPPPSAMRYRPLAIRVQWRDTQGRWQQQRPPLAALLQLPEAEVTLPGVSQRRLVQRYWDYR